MASESANLKFWSFMGLAVLLLIATAAAMGMADSCESGFAAVEIRKKAAAGCGEFWFNRYQTSIAALGALLAALIAARPVWRQLGEMREQLSEMRRQSAQQAFPTLRSLGMQFAEEALIVRNIVLNAHYCLAFEDGLEENIKSPAYAIAHEAEFSVRVEKLEELEAALRECATRSLSNEELQNARDELYRAVINLRCHVIDMRMRMIPILNRFRGSYNEAQWIRASIGLRNISARVQVDAVVARCIALDTAIREEEATIEPLLARAKATAFDL